MSDCIVCSKPAREDEYCSVACANRAHGVTWPADEKPAAGRPARRRPRPSLNRETLEDLKRGA